MQVKFLDLQKITAKYADQMHEAVLRVVDSGWYLQGHENERFEANYSKYIGSKHTIGCANGLDALIWIFRAYIEMGVMQPGDEVIVPAYTYTASASVVCHVGATPVMVDSREDSPEMDYDAAEAAITERTKAIIPVDLGGIPCDYDRIFAMVERKKAMFRPVGPIQTALGRVAVMADTAHSFGATQMGKPTGCLADFSAFSFHAVKNLTTAEGGAKAADALMSADPDLDALIPAGGGGEPHPGSQAGPNDG